MAKRTQMTTAALGAATILSSVVGVAVPAHAATQICGTILGTDGRYVNAQVSLEWRNPATGAKSNGYEDNITFVNKTVGNDGSTTGTANFCVSIDSRATEYRLEAYPKLPTGVTDYTHYSGAAHDFSPVTTVPALRFARVDGPNTMAGGIRATAYDNGTPVPVTYILATGENANPQGARGFGTADKTGPGPLTKNSLAANSRYSVEVTFKTLSGATKTAGIYGVGVRPGAVTDIVAYSGTKPSSIASRWNSKAVSQSGTYVPLAGDFTGDGKTDVLWYGPGSGADSFSAATSGGDFAAPAARNIIGVYQPAVGDFDGNGVDDVFWYAPGTPADFIWNYSAGGSYTSRPLPSAGTSTNRAYVGDFDNNGVDDLLFCDPNGQDALRLMRKDGTYKQFPLNLPAGTVKVGDLNADLKADVQIWTPGQNYQTVNVFISNGAGGFTQRVDTTGNGLQPIVGDFNADFRADVVEYAPGTATDYLWRGWMSDNITFAKDATPLNVHGTYSRPFVGDFDGNGLADIYWYQPGTGSDAMWLNNPGGWNNGGVK